MKMMNRRLSSPGQSTFVVVQRDGTLALVPAWMVCGSSTMQPFSRRAPVCPLIRLMELHSAASTSYSLLVGYRPHRPEDNHATKT